MSEMEAADLFDEQDVTPEEEPEIAEAEAEPIEDPEPAAEPEAEVPPEESPESVAVEPAQGEAETEAPEPSSDSPDVQSEPFSFRAYGSQVDVPGAVRQRFTDSEGTAHDYVTIPTDVWQRVIHPRLHDPAKAFKERQELQTRIEELDPEKNPEVAEARKVLEDINRLLEMDESEAWEWLQNAKREIPRLRAEAKAAALQKRLELSKEQEGRRSTEVKQVEDLRQIQSDIPTRIAAFANALGVQLPDDVAQQLAVTIWEDRDRFYVPAPENNPDGLTPGQIVARNDLFRRQIELAGSLLKRASPQAASEIAKKNEAVLGTRKTKKPPPTVPTGSAPAAATKQKKYKSLREWDEDIERAMGEGGF